MFKALMSQVRTIWTILQHSFTRAETVQYPEQKPYLAPRYRGRIVLTKDPDGEERCVACNLCAVALPCRLHCLATGRERGWSLVSGIFPHQFFPLHHVRYVRRGLPDQRDTANT